MGRDLFKGSHRVTSILKHVVGELFLLNPLADLSFTSKGKSQLCVNMPLTPWPLSPAIFSVLTKKELIYDLDPQAGNTAWLEFNHILLPLDLFYNCLLQ